MAAMLDGRNNRMSLLRELKSIFMQTLYYMQTI